MRAYIGEWSNERVSEGGGERVCFDGLRIWCEGAGAFIGELVRRASAGEKTLACYLNAHTCNVSYRDADYRSILSRAELLYPDGMSVVWAVRLLAGRRTERMTGVDFFEDFLRASADRGLKLYFLGSRPGVAERAAAVLRGRHRGLRIVGTHHGYLGDDTQAGAILADINASGADVLLVGMGSPMQEKFAWRNRESLGSPVIWTVGALFDYYGGAEKAGPRWLARLGFEWLYRLSRDPKHKWRRYLVGNWQFVFRVVRLKVRQLRFGKRDDGGYYGKRGSDEKTELG